MYILVNTCILLYTTIYFYVRVYTLYSAVWICQAHQENNKNGRHVAVDPNQTSQYENMGRTLVQRSGLGMNLFFACVFVCMCLFE